MIGAMSGIRRHTLLVVVLCLLTTCVSAPRQAEPLPEWDARFSRTDGWTGGDGAFSVDLGDRILWLFGDTWIGPVIDGAHHGARIVRNTIAIQRGDTLEFIEREFFAPRGSTGWMWPLSGFRAGGKLHILLSRMDRAGRDDIWDFRFTGTCLATIDNPGAHPDAWNIRHVDLPGGPWGAAALVAGDTAYIYGTHDDTGRQDRAWRVAKVPLARVEEVGAWTFGTTDLFWGAAPEGSVSTHDGELIAIYSDRGMSDRILMRTAPAPEGPWSEPRLVYRCPEAAWDPDNFCYAAKGHPEISPDEALVVSYCVNCSDFWKMARNAGIYRPRFVSIPLAP